MALLDPETIRDAIGHPEPMVRACALRYFNRTGCTDTTVMPRVIEAIEHYGLDQTWRLALSARSLPQTPATMNWLVERLQRPFDRDDVLQANQHDALAWLLVAAEPGLLSDRFEQITGQLELPSPLREQLDERLALNEAGWDACWERLEALGQTMTEDEGDEAVERDRQQQLGHLIEALARHGWSNEQRERFVLELVRRQFPADKRPLYRILEPEVLRLAGRMRLTEAAPVLVRRLIEERVDEPLTDAAIVGLCDIGGDAVAEPLAHAWESADPDARSAMGEVLGHIPTERAAERCLAFLKREPGPEVQQMLALAAMWQFNIHAVEPVAALVADDQLLEEDMEWQAVREALVEVATIMGVRFLQYEAWYEDAREAWEAQEDTLPGRLFEAEPAMLDRTGRSLGIEDEPDLIWRLTVTLSDVNPPVWRRLELPDCSLDELHILLQKAFGWEQVHAYVFRHHGIDYMDPEFAEEEASAGTRDVAETWLSDLVGKPGDRVQYIYDLGDHWEHQITVDEVIETDDPFVPPACLDGAGACPPEDVGGPAGYAAYLAALSDPDHEDHARMLAWNGAFDSAAFDLEATNAEVRRDYDR